MARSIRPLLAILLALPAAGSDPCDVTYPKERAWHDYQHSWTPLTRYGHLETLFDRHQPQDLPVFISLLNCFTPVGREGDTTAELVFGHLKAVISLEFETLPLKSFETDSAYRARIMAAYQAWWQEHGAALEFDATCGEYFSKATTKEDRKRLQRAHERWYIESFRH